MDLPQNPGNYVAAQAQFDSRGQMFVVVQNRAPIPLTAIQVTPVLIDGSGRIVREGSPVRLSNVVKPGEQASAFSGISNVPPEQLQSLRFRVDGAQIAE